MKARTLTFWIDADYVDQALQIVDEDVLPAYRQSEHFLGLVILRSEVVERQVMGLSIWDGDRPGCEDVMTEFRDRLTSLTGTSPSATTYEVLRLASVLDI
jgi:hypothetical protein